tara:strand:- start:3495 stop:4028 length:534 start_codon:yes stop_codon:yes gene_type:complete
MQVSLIVSVVGSDRPGLVEQLSTAITTAGGNWEGSRLVRLGGQFAGMVQVIIPDSELASLESSLAGLEETGLKVTTVHSGQTSTATESASVYLLEVVGQDRPGIVRTIASALASEGVNVIELATDCRQAPMSGECLFHTNAKLLIPESVDSDDLRARIEEIATDLMVELAREIDSNH